VVRGVRGTQSSPAAMAGGGPARASAGGHARGLACPPREICSGEARSMMMAPRAHSRSAGGPRCRGEGSSTLTAVWRDAPTRA
jgi:hypothetical protein